MCSLPDHCVVVDEAARMTGPDDHSRPDRGVTDPVDDDETAVPGISS
ncbi:MAG: hypothetical protein H6974_04625 [Gammaproteobacteria bacterium]|nr:hypothetical protein [Gammaproteobacteria bacterium]